MFQRFFKPKKQQTSPEKQEEKPMKKLTNADIER